MQVLSMMSKSVQQANGVFIAHAIQATPMCTVGMFGAEVHLLRCEFHFTPEGLRRTHASIGEIEMRSCFSSINEL